MSEKLPLTGGDTNQAMAVIWNVIEEYQEAMAADDQPLSDEQNCEINTAMAWIKEKLDE